MVRLCTVVVLVGGYTGLAMGEVTNGGGLYEELVIDVSGLGFTGELGDPLNTVIESTDFPVAEYMRVAAVRWDVNISTMPFSWLSEASLWFSVESGNGFSLSPGAGDDFFGSNSYSSGWVELSDFGVSMWVGSDSMIRMELYEAFDDVAGIDAFFGTGSTVTLGLQIPSPGGVGVLMLGGLVGVRRRR